MSNKVWEIAIVRYDTATINIHDVTQELLDKTREEYECEDYDYVAEMLWYDANNCMIIMTRSQDIIINDHRND